MTKKYFDSSPFSSKTKVKYKNEVYSIVSVDYTQRLIGLLIPANSETTVDTQYWVRYEGIELI